MRESRIPHRLGTRAGLRNIMKKFLWIVLCLSMIVFRADAAFWQCQLPGGDYMVSLASIASVSMHEYVVDGAARVTEMTVGTNSSVVARFYYLEPMTPKSPIGIGQSVIDRVQERVEDVAERTGVEEVWKKVVKNYPTTTHAHTVEYRVDSVDQLKKLEKSLQDAWRSGQETTIKVP